MFDRFYRNRYGYTRWDGTQKIENTGALTKKRMETCDDEFLEAAEKFRVAAEAARCATAHSKA